MLWGNRWGVVFNVITFDEKSRKFGWRCGIQVHGGCRLLHEVLCKTAGIPQRFMVHPWLEWLTPDATFGQQYRMLRANKFSFAREHGAKHDKVTWNIFGRQLGFVFGLHWPKIYEQSESLLAGGVRYTLAVLYREVPNKATRVLSVLHRTFSESAKLGTKTV